jgi:hypothetical protein
MGFLRIEKAAGATALRDTLNWDFMIPGLAILDHPRHIIVSKLAYRLPFWPHKAPSN